MERIEKLEFSVYLDSNKRTIKKSFDNLQDLVDWCLDNEISVNDKD